MSPLSSEMERGEGERGRGAKLPFSATAKKAGHPIQRRGGKGGELRYNQQHSTSAITRGKGEKDEEVNNRVAVVVLSS